MEIGAQTYRTGDLHAAGDMEVRQRVHSMWAAVAGAWKEHADYVDKRAARISKRLIALSSPAPGDRVLELACGAGGLGLEVAKLVDPGGKVVVSDVAQEMIDVAMARAAALGISNVSGRPLDIEAIVQPDASYDVVLCREGLMFALNPARAVQEMVRVLTPGGRLAVSVWGARSANPWLGRVFDAASAVLDRPIPPPGIPGPFSLGEPGQLSAALANSDLVDITVEEVVVETVAASFEEYWNRTSALAGPLSKILAGLPPEGIERLKAKLHESLEPYENPDGLRIPGVALVAAGTRG
jgi:ubiquinone/menaquinone biosynthesis C-methylase UbiE